MSVSPFTPPGINQIITGGGKNSWSFTPWKSVELHINSARFHRIQQAGGTRYVALIFSAGSLFLAVESAWLAPHGTPEGTASFCCSSRFSARAAAFSTQTVATCCDRTHWEILSGGILAPENHTRSCKFSLVLANIMLASHAREKTMLELHIPSRTGKTPRTPPAEQNFYELSNSMLLWLCYSTFIYAKIIYVKLVIIYRTYEYLYILRPIRVAVGGLIF